MALSENAEKMLNLIPEGGRIGGGALWEALRKQGVGSKAADAAEAELLAANRIAIGRGRGGSYRCVGSDEEEFMRLLDVSGAMRTNAELREALGLNNNHEQYWERLRKLIKQGLVRVGRGRGGKVGRVVRDSDDAPSVAAPIAPASTSISARPNPTANEASWYPVVER